jgi:predicted dithiol-disulfide oxidoreductase (DUF899 family)
MGWRFTWVSSYESDFNYDFNVSFTPERIAAGSAYYNFQHNNPGMLDLSGDSIFFKDEAGQIFHTYSIFGRGGEEFLGIYRFLDLTPKGRDERGPYRSLATGRAPRTCTARAAWSRGMADITYPPAPALSMSERRFETN